MTNENKKMSVDLIAGYILYVFIKAWRWALIELIFFGAINVSPSIESYIEAYLITLVVDCILGLILNPQNFFENDFWELSRSKKSYWTEYLIPLSLNILVTIFLYIVVEPRAIVSVAFFYTVPPMFLGINLSYLVLFLGMPKLNSLSNSTG